MDAQDAQIRTLNERIIELDLEVMEKCRRIDSLLTPPPDAAVREATAAAHSANAALLIVGVQLKAEELAVDELRKQLAAKERECEELRLKANAYDNLTRAFELAAQEGSKVERELTAREESDNG